MQPALNGLFYFRVRPWLILLPLFGILLVSHSLAITFEIF